MEGPGVTKRTDEAVHGLAAASGQAQVLVASCRGGVHHSSCRAVTVPMLRGARRAGARTAHCAAARGAAS